MRSDDEAGAEASTPREAARLAFRNEISVAITGIIDRDHFLQRLARRVAEVTGTTGVAIYTRASAGGDFMLRSSTVPKSERVPPRVSGELRETTSEVTDGTDDDPTREVMSIP